MIKLSRASFLFAAFTFSNTAAFTTISSRPKQIILKNNNHEHKNGVIRPQTTALSSSKEELNELLQSYGEQARKFRRTVYTHDDWLKHRSSDRFFRNLKSITDSGVNRNLYKEVIATVSVSAFIILWNGVFGDYQDFSGVTHAGIFHDSSIPILALPLAPFTLSSSFLGLLLGE